MRTGTENAAGIAGFGRAAELAVINLPSMKKVSEMRDRMAKKIMELVPDAWINGHITERLPNTLNMTLPGIRGESMVLALDQQGVSLASGSACRSGSPNPSHVLLAIGLSQEEAHCSIRLSLGASNSFDQIESASTFLERVINGSRNSVRFVPCR
jgi:cysteine sulfinate desulfinase/cysteine desulfurase-like protein